MKEIGIETIYGFQIGHAQDEKGGTGCTAIVAPEGATAGVEVRGGAPATRETSLLHPYNKVEQAHCVLLCGGSAYGLAAADGAMTYLEEKNCGFDVGIGKVPIVPAAALFDLAVGNMQCRPDAQMGYTALKNAEKNCPKEGNVGAGTGATVGKLKGMAYAMKGGLGLYALSLGALQIGAVVAVNALGNIVDEETGAVLAGLLDAEKRQIISTRQALYDMVANPDHVFTGNTTLGCIITNAKLSKSQCGKVASMAHNGYARTIYPVHTTADGDTVFTLSRGEVEVPVDVVGTLAAAVMAKAINRGVRQAKGAYGLPAYSDLTVL